MRWRMTTSSNTGAAILPSRMANMTPSGSGVPGGSYSFDGSDYITIPAFALVGTALTFAAWVKRSYQAAVDQTFFGDGAAEIGVGFIFCDSFPDTDDLVWQYTDAGAYRSAISTDFFLGHTDVWVHFAIVADYDAETFAFYRNGVLFSSGAMTAGAVFPSASRVRYLGVYDPPLEKPLTDGSISSVQLWTRALSAGEIVAEFSVRYLAGEGKGAGSARNIGWRTAENPLVWFIDSDCVADPDALMLLLPHLDDPQVAAVGGSYGIMTSHSLLACLIHEEIVERHLSMPGRVNFLATFNVIYRRPVLEAVGGFDERFLKGQDAELSWRVLEAGHELAFEINSRVKHFHAVSWRQYLRTQRQQGYWRVWLHLRHRGHARGDSYSRLTDHVQPPVAAATLAALPLLWFSATKWVPIILVLGLAAAQIPMTWRLVRRTRQARYVAFAAMSFLRAFWRGVGMCVAVAAAPWTMKKGRSRRKGD